MVAGVSGVVLYGSVIDQQLATPRFFRLEREVVCVDIGRGAVHVGLGVIVVEIYRWGGSVSC